MHFDKDLFYSIVGRIFIWIILSSIILYLTYNIGYDNGKLDGYWIGYTDGYFRLKPADPNLSKDERRNIQKMPIFPKSNKNTMHRDTSVPVKL